MGAGHTSDMVVYFEHPLIIHIRIQLQSVDFVHLLQIITLVGGMKPERNKQSTSTIPGSRLDAWLGQPPLVLVEEKADVNDRKEAKAELRSKVRSGESVRCQT